MRSYHINILELATIFIALKKAPNSKGIPHSSPFGQHDSSGVSEQEGLGKITSLELVDVVNSEPLAEEQMGGFGLPCSGGSERPCRFPVSS